MTERDKRIEQAEALECIALELHNSASELRALAAQQEPVGEPVAYMIWAPFTGPAQFTTDKNAPIKTAQRADYTCTPLYAHANDFKDAYVGAREDLAVWKRRALAAEENNRQLTRALQGEVNSPTFMGEPSGVHFADHPNLDKASPQASAPAEPVIDGYPLEQGIPPAPAADLDALWQAAWADYGFIGDRAEARKLYQAITDLRAQLESERTEVEVKSLFITKHLQRIAKDRERITALEADNKEARELLRKWRQQYPALHNDGVITVETDAVLAKQGD